MKVASTFNPFPIRIWGGNIFWRYYFGVETAVEVSSVILFPWGRPLYVDKIQSPEESFDVCDTAERTIPQLLVSKGGLLESASMIHFAFTMPGTRKVEYNLRAFVTNWF